MSSPATTATPPFMKGVSGSMQGAGGVGGLLVQGDLSSGEVYRATYDGNGNVMCWTEKDEVRVRWRGEYDAFGNVAVSEGENPSEYGFSTKVRDRSTGLSYYDYRYYDAETERWLSRDPIEEEGGINLYRFVGNDGVSRFDYLGLELRIIYKNLKVGTCGLFTVDRHFLFDPVTAGDGYIVMHVKSGGWKSGCNSGRIDISGEYYEAFTVRRGAATTLNMELAMKHLEQKDWHSGADRAAYGGNGDCTRGEYIQEVEAKFYAINDTGYLGGGGSGNNTSLQPDWGVDPGIPNIHGGVSDDPDVSGNPSSGAAPSTSQKPEFWDQNPLESTKAKVTARWDCCSVSTDKSTKVVLSP